MIPVVRSAGSREKDWLYKHGNFLPSTRCEMSPASGENVCHGATMKRYRSSNPFDRLCWRSLTPDTLLQKHRSIVHAIGRTPVVKQHRENRAERESCRTPRISHKRSYDLSARVVTRSVFLNKNVLLRVHETDTYQGSYQQAHISCSGPWKQKSLGRTPRAHAPPSLSPGHRQNAGRIHARGAGGQRRGEEAILWLGISE